MGTGTNDDESDNSRRDGDAPAWSRRGLRGRRPISPPAAGAGREREFRGKTGVTGQNASRTSDQDGPEPGHLTRRRARSEREPARALRRRADGTGAPASTAVIRERMPAPDDRSRAHQRPRSAAERQEGR